MATDRFNRLASLDCLRGLAVAVMIVVNNPGDSRLAYPHLRHAAWNGWTVADLVFPLFLFLVGASVGLVVPREPAASGEMPGLWPKAIRRAGILFGLGLLENAYWRFSFESLRWPGVLQRISLVYLAAVWGQTRLGDRAVGGLIAATLLGYWLLLAWTPVPGLGRPSLEAGANLQGWLDQALLGGHIWKFGTTWDPEGVLSTVPAMALGLIGVLAGRWLRRGGAGAGRVCLLGFGLLLAGLVWNLWFPINKSICTSSFVLFVGGGGVMLLAGGHRLLDGPGRSARVGPLAMLGQNALALYLTASFVSATLRHVTVAGGPEGGQRLQAYLYQALFAGWPQGGAASLAWSVLYLLVLFLGAWGLHVRGILIKI